MPNSLQYQADQERVEQAVDNWNVSTVLGMLETICYAKSAHLNDNWQDRDAAKMWSRMAARINRCVNVIEKLEP